MTLYTMQNATRGAHSGPQGRTMPMGYKDTVARQHVVVRPTPPHDLKGTSGLTGFCSFGTAMDSSVFALVRWVVCAYRATAPQIMYALDVIKKIEKHK